MSSYYQLKVKTNPVLKRRKVIIFLYFILKKKKENRVKYNQQHYMKVFSDEESVKMLMESVEQPSLILLLEVIKFTSLFLRF